MIISHKYEFIFIKTRKTAGTSIEVYFSGCCGRDDVVTPIFPHVEPHKARNYRGIWNPIPEILAARGQSTGSTLKSLLKARKYHHHISASKLQHRVSKHMWDSYYKFCVERNPWDKTISHYYMINDRQGGNLTLDEYIDRGDFCLDLPKYTSSGGKVLVDRVLKYENLMEELGEVLEQLGVPFNGSLGVRAKSSHRRDKSHYRDIFTDMQCEAIRKAFAEEIKLHGYRY